MPFELIVQSPFTERLDANRVRVWKVGEHITDPDKIQALKGQQHVVQVWVDEKPAPKPQSVPQKSVIEATKAAPIAPAPEPAKSPT